MTQQETEWLERIVLALQSHPDLRNALSAALRDPAPILLSEWQGLEKGSVMRSSRTSQAKILASGTWHNKFLGEIFDANGKQVYTCEYPDRWDLLTHLDAKALEFNMKTP